MIKQLIEAKGAIKSLFSSILDLVFPNTCLDCNLLTERDRLICDRCLKKLQPLASLKIGKLDPGIEVFSRFQYRQPIKSLIQSKYSQDTSMLSKAGRLLYASSGLDYTLKNSEIDGWIIVPVPLHWTRQLKRGFNQAHTLAQGLASSIGAPVVGALYRKRCTNFQSSAKTKAERTANVFNAFAINTTPIIGWTKSNLAKRVYGKGVIIVDDLLTTGATLLECAKVIRNELNPKIIIAVTLCRS
jgi:ComF family protein